MWVPQLICGLFLLGLVQTENDSKCNIEDIKDEDWSWSFSKEFFDNDFNIPLLESTYTGKIENLNCVCNATIYPCEHEYLNINKNETHIYIFTTEELKHFDEDMLKIPTSSRGSILYRCSMTCQDENKKSLLKIQTKIKDYNDFSPEFVDGERTYKVASPIMPETDFTIYGVPLYAYDKDFNNSDITFDIQPNDFDIIKTKNSNESPERFMVNFKAKSVMNIQKSTTYTITATDNGIYPGPKSTPLKIQLDVNEDISLDLPTFIYPSDTTLQYSFEYQSKDGSLKPNNGPIKIETKKPKAVKNLKLSGEMATNFETKYDETTSEVTLTAIKKIENPTSAYTVLSLSITTDYQVSTPITIHFSDVPVDEGPKFNLPLYIGNYDDTEASGSVTLENKIVVNKMSSDVKLEITGDFSVRFDLVSDDNNQSFKIKVVKPLTAEEIKSNQFIHLTIKATLDSKSDTSGLIIKLPKHELQFKKQLYVATYKTDHTLDAEDISFVNDVADVTITVNKDYQEYFKVTYENQKYQLIPTKHLSDEILKSQTEIVITLTAVDKFKNQAISVVKVTLPALNESEAPTFSEPYYVTQYKQDQEYLELENNIKFANVDDNTEVTINLRDHSENFKVIFDTKESKWRVQVINPLSIDDYKNDIIITMEAADPKFTGKGIGVLVIKIDNGSNNDKAPTFAQLYYTAQYSQEQTDFIDFNPKIEVNNIKDILKISLSLNKYSDNFEPVYDSDKWRLKIKKPLDSGTFEDNSELIATMTVKEPGVDKEGVGVLVIELIKSNDNTAPKFAQLYYTAQYSQEQTDFIDFNPKIEVNNIKDISKISLSLNNYTDNFEPVYDSDKWRLKIKKPLDSGIFEDNSELIATMIVKEPGVDKEGVGVLVIELIKSNDNTAPKFAQLYYTAQYSQEQTDFIDFNPKIEVKNVKDISKISLSLNKYTDNFEPVYDSDKWRLKIKNPLDSETFEDNSELIATMTVKEPGVNVEGAGVLVIELIKSNDNTAPKFAELYYTAQYSQEQTDFIDFNPKIEVNNIKDISKITLSLNKYTDNFEPVYDSDKWRLKIKKPLDSGTFEDNSELIATMTVKEPGVNIEGAGVLVIELIKSNDNTAPKFAQLYYTAQYSQEQTDFIDFNPKIEVNNIKDISKITLSLNKYSDNFEPVYDSDKWRLKIKNPLDSGTFEDNFELIATMTVKEPGVNIEGAGVLVIELIKSNNDKAPKFAEMYYTAQYSQDQTDFIDFIPKIEVNNIKDIAKISLSLNKYSDNFEPVYDSDKWRLKIKNPLDSGTFEDNSELIATMTVKEPGVNIEGAGVLVIELIKSNNDKAPKFAEMYYTAQYSQDQTDFIDFIPKIEVNNIKDIAKISLSLNKYSDNFEPVYDSDKWRLKIKNPLDSGTFEENSELIATMTVKEPGVNIEGAGVLVIELIKSNNDKAPKFAEMYYTAQYSQDQTDFIDFIPKIEVNNIKDIAKISLSLNKYSDNFEPVYDSDKWRLKIKNPLDSGTFEDNSELIATMTVKEPGVNIEGSGVLVIELIKSNNDKAPKFAEMYYTAQYSQDQTDFIDFIPKIEVNNIKDIAKISLSLNKYSDNFEPVYDSDKWRLKIKNPLDSGTFEDNSELIATMTVKEPGVNIEGSGVLVIELIKSNNDKAPKFAEMYYTAQYSQDQTDFIDFIPKIEVNNIKDIAKISLSLNKYSDNFEPVYDSDKWRLKIKNSLDSGTFEDNSELIATMTVKEPGVNIEGLGVLVIELIKSNNDKAPKFAEMYYTAQYSQDQTDFIDFNPKIEVNNIKDITKISLSLNKYTDNFEPVYNSDKWRLKIKKPLDSGTFEDNSELIATITVKEPGVNIEGAGVLVIELKKSEGPKFTEPIYALQYEKDEKEFIDFEQPLTLKNIKNIEKVTINLNGYKENFLMVYTENKWRLKIINPLADELFTTGNALTLTMEVTEESIIGNTAVLVINLHSNNPKFKEVYYEADYPESGKGQFSFKNQLEFENIKNHNIATIWIGDYASNFKVDPEKNWTISIISPLDNTLLKKKYIVTKLYAKTDDDIEIETAFVLNLPQKEPDEGPDFDRSYYTAEYALIDKGAIVTFNNNIGFKNKNDMSIIQIVSDEFSKYFTLNYDNDGKVWKLVVEKILDEKYFTGTDLVVGITATDTTNKLTGHSIIDLKLPIVDTDDAPKFNQAYYTGSYKASGENFEVTLDNQFKFSNQDGSNVNVYTSGAYAENFKFSYENKVWSVAVSKNLDSKILDANSEIIMEISAQDKKNNKISKSALMLTLPTVNDKNAPKFDQTSYTATYDSSTTDLNLNIKIINKEDLGKIHVSIMDEDYQKYFKINYNKNSESWNVVVAQNSPLDTLFDSQNDLVLSLSATEDGNTEIGKAALVISLVKQTAPKFSEPQYYGNYTDNLDFKIDFNITNKNLDTIDVTFSSKDGDFSDYFEIKRADNMFEFGLKNLLKSEIIKGHSILLFKLTATEKDNDKIGEASLIIYLPERDPIHFNEPYYTGDYVPNENGLAEVKLNKVIKITSTLDISKAEINIIQNPEYFDISSLSENEYGIKVVKNLPDNEIQKQQPILLPLEAKLDNHITFATLVIRLPTNTDSELFTFEKPLYTGEYKVTDDDEVIFNADVVSLKDLDDDSNISIKIEDSKYAEYFRATLENKSKVTITKKADLPKEVFSNQTVISLILSATSSKSTHKTETVVDIKIVGKTSDTGGGSSETNNTGYIVAISILSVLILLILLAAALLYYLRKRKEKLGKMTYEEYVNSKSKVRFDKTARNSGERPSRSLAIETRRPTGINLGNMLDEPRESITEDPDLKERKKSVAFDENVEKLQIDKNDEDVEKGLEGNQNVNAD